MEATENDFLRLKDIYSEVKTRVNSLYRQHKKAERYQRLTDEIKAWDLHLASIRLKERQQQRRELKAQFDESADQKAARETTLDTAYAQLEEERKELIGIEQQLSALGSEIYETTEQAHQAERESSVLREKKTNAAQLIEKNRGDIETLDQAGVGTPRPDCHRPGVARSAAGAAGDSQSTARQRPHGSGRGRQNGFWMPAWPRRRKTES